MAPSVAEDWELPLTLDLDEPNSPITDAPPSRPSKKRDCEHCERPRSVCLCATLPPAPLQLAGRVIILQHPHEHKKRLATVPVLQKCVAPGCLEVLRGRAYRPGDPPHAALEAALAGAAEGRHPLLVLFPGAGARDVREVGAELRAAAAAAAEAAEAAAPAASQQPGGPPQAVSGSAAQRSERDCAPAGSPQHSAGQQGSMQGGASRHDAQGPARRGQPCAQRAQQQRSGRHSGGHPLYVLFVIDGTWKQAKEMLKAVAPHVLPPSGPGLRVQLPPAAAQEPAQRGAAVGPAQQQAIAQQQPQQQVGQQSTGQQQQQEEQQQTGQQQMDQRQDKQQEAQRQQQQEVQQQQEEQQQEAQRQVPNGPPLCAAGAAGDCSGQAAAPAAAAGGSGLGGPLLIRMEPLEGCVTTCEAVARALGALEPAGEAVEAAVLRPLTQLAHFQAQFDPSTAARLAEASVGYSQARRRMGLSRQRDLTQIP